MRRFFLLTGLMIGVGLLAGISRPARADDAAADAPTIVKDSVSVKAFTLTSYQKSYDVWSWVPGIRFSVNGPIASGSPR